MEKYVCNKELSKKLEKLGVKQESEFYWVEIKVINEIQCELVTKKYFNAKGLFKRKYYSAFTVGELGEMSPDTFDFDDDEYILTVKKYRGEYTISYDYRDKVYLEAITDKSEANAKAKMLVYLVENKLIDKRKLNG